MLLVQGPNVMKGYLDRPDLTAQVIRDGWYMTGDVARIDADGFIHITDRLSRFSKIGGEMVPHIRIEEAIRGLLDLDEEERAAGGGGRARRKEGRAAGGLARRPAAERRRRSAAAWRRAGCRRIWIPSPDSFRQVEAIPAAGDRQTRLEATEGVGDGRVWGGPVRMIF